MGTKRYIAAAGMAALFGITFATDVLAVKEGERCGGFAVIKCDNGLWCDLDAGCGSDMGGVCVVVPKLCAPEFRPVCGCDDHTYTNDCQRMAGKSKRWLMANVRQRSRDLTRRALSQSIEQVQGDDAGH